MSCTSSCTYECAVVVRKMSAILLKIKNNIQLLNIPGIITKFMCTSIPQISLSSEALDVGSARLGEYPRGDLTRAAGRTIARYLRDVVKTHARNSDVTPVPRFSAYALAIHEVQARGAFSERLGSARLGRRCTRTGERAGRPVLGSLDFIHLPDNRRVPVCSPGTCQRASARAQGPGYPGARRNVEHRRSSLSSCRCCCTVGFSK